MKQCVNCSGEVTGRQHAVKCDSCHEWTHRRCNSGISFATYRAAVTSGGDLPYVCMLCQTMVPNREVDYAVDDDMDHADENGDVQTIDLHDTSDTRTIDSVDPDDVLEPLDDFIMELTMMEDEGENHVPQETPVINYASLDGTYTNDFEVPVEEASCRLHIRLPRHAMESTRISVGADLIGNPSDLELTQDESHADIVTPTHDAEETLFDVTRPHRSLESEDIEMSIADETIRADDLRETEAATTFEIVDTGSIRGKRKLVSTAGYSFVFKRQLKNGTTEWRCSVRGHKSGCPAVVRQSNDEFTPSQHSHTHPAQPGILTAIQVKSEPAYQAKDSVYKAVRKIFALPLLPADDIDSAFQSISNKVDREATNAVALLTYVEDTWINSTVWPKECWSVYGKSVRTNNDVEGWHARMNRRAQNGNLPFYMLLTLLYREAAEIPTQVKLVREGKLRRHQRKQTTRVQGQLMQLWEQYGQHLITTSTLSN